MTATETRPSLDEVRRAGLAALRRELGPRGLVRFLRQFIQPAGDYTAERAELQASMTMDDVIADIEKARVEGEQAQNS